MAQDRGQRPQISTAIDFAEVPLLEQPGRAARSSSQVEATRRSTISRSRPRVTFALRHATCVRTLDHVSCAKALYGEGGSFSRCKVNISPRQHFMRVEAVLGEVSGSIVGHSENAPGGS